MPTLTKPDIDFTPFPKIPRLFKGETWVTEKIDGTNASVYITEEYAVHAASRTRWITPDSDNFGFARWVADHADDLREHLGPGHHFGEWWGSKIQRGYGLTNGERRFSLFNVKRWWFDFPEALAAIGVDVVPLLWTGEFNTGSIVAAMRDLARMGSAAAPGFMDPEGVMVYHTASNLMFKCPFDPLPKSAS